MPLRDSTKKVNSALADGLFRLASPCRLCEYRCGVNRLQGERGRCGAGPGLRVYNAFVHHGEEPVFSPSLSFFLSGCSFRCASCSDASAVLNPNQGKEMDEADVAALAAHILEPYRSVAFVGGSPEVRLPWIAQALEELPASAMKVLVTNLYLTEEALEGILPLLDLIVADLKFGEEACAARLAQVIPYREVVGRNLIRVDGETGCRLVVRHLMLPGHDLCCTSAVVKWVSNELSRSPLNLMTGYLPMHRAAEVGLNGPLPKGVVAKLLASPEAQKLRAAERLWVDGRQLPGGRTV